MDPEPAVMEQKLGMSLDELIAEQRKKRPAKTAKKTPAKKTQAQTKGGGRVLIVPRPKDVPRPSPKSGVKGTRGGGVRKKAAAPKFVGGQRQQGGAPRQATNRAVKVTIGNKLGGRAPDHFPTTGVLSKPFVAAGGGARGNGGRVPVRLEAPPGANLSTRFDTISGVAPAGPARPTGQPRRNAHGVLLP